MVFLSATNFFSEAFTWFANLSSKLPQIDFKTYFIVVVALLIGVGVIIGLTFLGCYRFKLTFACKKIIRYLKGVEFIDDDNFGDFTAQCFSVKAPSALRDCWVQYLGVRFGYPSDIVSEENVYDSQVKRVREIRANVYVAIALIMLAIFSFWGYGTLDGKDMGVIFLAGLLLIGAVYLVLVILNRLMSKRCLETFSTMQEDLDAKVNLQVEKSFATDSSPLADLAAIIDEIVARNTAKEIGFGFADGITPIEQLIASAPEEVQSKADEENEIELDYINMPAESEDDEADRDSDVKDEDTDEKDIDEDDADEVEDDLAEDINEEDEIIEDDVDEAADEEDSEGVSEEVEAVEDDGTEDIDETDDEEVIEDDDTVDDEDVTEEVEAVDDDVTEDIGEADDEDVTEEVEAVDDDVTEDIDEADDEEVIEDNDTVEDDVTEDIENVDDEDVAEEVEAVENDVTENIDDTDNEEAVEEIDDTFEEDIEENTDGADDIVQADGEESVSETSNDEESGAEDVLPQEDIGATQDDTEDDEGFDTPVEGGDPTGDGDANTNDEEAEDAAPEVRYVVDGASEDEEVVKPAKLVKLPNLVDYMLSQNLSRKVKMQMAMMLLSSYKKFESSAEDKAIILNCMKKLMFDLQTKR